ncbi:MAG: branched-chain amino acid ABC transporter permease [Candidatus Aenigmatarchaeota archaeon]
METIFYIFFAILQIGVIYALISLGFNILYSTTRIINVAYGEFITLGAFLAYWLYVIYKITPEASIFASMAFAILLAIPLHSFIFKPILSKRNVIYIEIWGVIVTFGLSLFMQGMMSYLWSGSFRGYSYLDEIIDLGIVSFMLNKVLIIFIGLLFIIITYLLFYRTELGILMRAIIQDPELAENLGLNTNKIFFLSTIISLGIAGAVGVLVSLMSEIHPFMGSFYLIIAFITTVLGGIGNPVGSLFAGFIVGSLDVLTGYIFGAGAKLVVIYLSLILILILRPTGLFGR